MARHDAGHALQALSALVGRCRELHIQLPQDPLEAQALVVAAIQREAPGAGKIRRQGRVIQSLRRTCSVDPRWDRRESTTRVRRRLRLGKLPCGDDEQGIDFSFEPNDVIDKDIAAALTWGPLVSETQASSGAEESKASGLPADHAASSMLHDDRGILAAHASTPDAINFVWGEDSEMKQDGDEVRASKKPRLSRSLDIAMDIKDARLQPRTRSSEVIVVDESPAQSPVQTGPGNGEGDQIPEVIDILSDDSDKEK